MKIRYIHRINVIEIKHKLMQLLKLFLNEKYFYNWLILCTLFEKLTKIRVNKINIKLKRAVV